MSNSQDLDRAYDRGRMIADATTLIMIPDRFRVMPTCKEPSAYGIAVGASIAAILSALEEAEAKAKENDHG